MRRTWIRRAMSPALCTNPVPGWKAVPVEQKYRKMSQAEHVLRRPDMYIGTRQLERVRAWAAVGPDASKDQEMVEVTVAPGLLKIVDEILVNAADNYHNTKETAAPQTELRVYLDQLTGAITVKNNGGCVDVKWHNDLNAYCPEVVFGNFNTGSNFDDETIRVTGGRNGIGAKATNALSKEFEVDIGDSSEGKRYRQVWRNSMDEVGSPEITPYFGEDYTKVRFIPNYAYFKTPGLDEAHLGQIRRRVADIAACCPGLKVYLNDEPLSVRSFRDYVHQKYDSADVNVVKEDAPLVEFTSLQDSQYGFPWEIGVGVRVCDQLSFVNSISTERGGTHVACIVNSVCGYLSTYLMDRLKGFVNPNYIRRYLSIYVNCSVGNPEFDSQTKDRLKSPIIEDLTRYVTVPEEFLKRIVRNDNIMKPVIEAAEGKIQRDRSGKRNKRVHLDKLDDAHEAGKGRAHECTLILTEGDSAKALAVAGLTVVGRELWGVYPLQGKVLNVSKSKDETYERNATLQAVAKVLGLDATKTYETEEERRTLRYGRVALMCDQDEDGSHIKGLVLNWFREKWPGLLRSQGFLSQIVTPLLKISIGKQKPLWFFTVSEARQWLEENPHAKGKCRVKYYKGLGTSTREEGMEYFKALFSSTRPLLVEFEPAGEADVASLVLAFGGENIADRREWLTSEAPELDTTSGKVSIEQFIHTDAMRYFMYSNERSIPNVIDGLKPSQRKVLFTAFELRLTGNKEMKVAQLGGAVAERTAYHHGEASLHEAIVKLSQDFVGSGNNVPLLEGIGQFGTRLQGGSDSASPRYISTRVGSMTRLLFPEEDDELLRLVVDEDRQVEPVHYVPILPVVLLNGAQGIGTGHATFVPSYDPLLVAGKVWCRLDNIVDNIVLSPWYHGHTGCSNHGYTEGTFQELDPTTDLITELPIGTWTDSFTSKLDALCRSNTIKGYTSHSCDTTVSIVVEYHKPRARINVKTKLGPLNRAFGKDLVRARLRRSLKHGKHAKLMLGKEVRCYPTPDAVIDDFFPVRLDLYGKRLEKKIEKAEQRIANNENFVRFARCMAEKSPLTHSEEEMFSYFKSQGVTNYKELFSSPHPPSAFSPHKIKARQEDIAKQLTILEKLRGTRPEEVWKVDVVNFLNSYIHRFTKKSERHSRTIRLPKSLREAISA